jgi:hypothetical protein
MKVKQLTPTSVDPEAVSNQAGHASPRRRLVKLPEDCRSPAITEPADDGYGRIAEMRERAFTSKSLRPSAASAITIRTVLAEQFGHIPDLTLDSLANELAAQCTAVANGHMDRPEAMLMSQAQTLDAVFQHLTQKAYNKINEIEAAERLLRLAFKAQGQCRATLETLGYLKNPPAVYAQQANLATGAQQVINQHVSSVREMESGKNELLEGKDGERVEYGSASSAGRCDSKVAPLAQLNGATDD